MTSFLAWNGEHPYWTITMTTGRASLDEETSSLRIAQRPAPVLSPLSGQQGAEGSNLLNTGFAQQAEEIKTKFCNTKDLLLLPSMATNSPPVDGWHTF